jgi:hypothetical protein
MLRKAIALVLACSILGAGLWLLYLQIFVWHGTIGVVALATGFMILAGLCWLLGDFVLPVFPGAQALLVRADNVLRRGNASLGRGFRKLGSGFVLLFRAAVWITGFLVFLTALVCWGFQGYAWLKDGEWIAVPVGAFVNFKSTGWLGVDKILLWLFDINIGVPLLFGGFGIMALSVMDREH